MKSLRTQLFGSHLILVALMALMMAGAVVSFLRLGDSIEGIFQNNYRSVVIAQTMKEVLERQDSATIFYLAGERGKARAQFARYSPVFLEALRAERANITEADEQRIADALALDYERYQRETTKLLRGEIADGNVFYFGQLEPLFRQNKARAQQILDLNQTAILRADERAKLEARRSAWLGAGFTLAALALAIGFARRAINLALTPLATLAREAERVGAGDLSRTLTLRRDDEIGVLARTFNEMVVHLRAARREQDLRLHRAQKMSDAALENLFDPVLVTDANRDLVHLNRAAQGVFGPESKLAGLPLSHAVAQPQIVGAIERAIASREVSADEGAAGLVAIACGDAERIYRLRATPMIDGETVLGAALVLEDVTHLQSLDRLKTEFIGVASHELKTPVTSLLLGAQLLEEGVMGALTPDQLEVVQAQREDLTRLNVLLGDLLDITRLEAGANPPRFEWVRPVELISHAARDVAGAARARNVEIEVRAPDDLPLVRADRIQIERVLLNLLTNAARHSAENSAVSVEAERAETGKIIFRVRDRGSGIPPEFIGRIWDRFVQVPGASGGGAGLGLPISQTIVGAHGGEIRVQSAVGQGSEFSFELEGQS